MFSRKPNFHIQLEYFPNGEPKHISYLNIVQKTWGDYLEYFKNWDGYYINLYRELNVSKSHVRFHIMFVYYV